MRSNLRNALVLAILVLREKKKYNPTLLDIFSQICQFSYNGDPRVGIAEDPSKIKSILGMKMADGKPAFLQYIHG